MTTDIRSESKGPRRIWLDQARALRAAVRENPVRSPAFRAEAMRLLAAMPKGAPALRLFIAELLLDTGDPIRCLTVLADEIWTSERAQPLNLRSRALAELGRVEEALVVARIALRRHPEDAFAAFQTRALRGFEAAPRSEPHRGAMALPISLIVRAASCDELAHEVGASDAKWIVPVVPGYQKEPNISQWECLAVDDRGFAALRADDVLRVWRRSSLALLIDTGLLDPGLTNLGSLERYFEPSAELPRRVLLLPNGLGQTGEQVEDAAIAPVLSPLAPAAYGNAYKANKPHNGTPAGLARMVIERAIDLVYTPLQHAPLAAAALDGARARLVCAVNEEAAVCPDTITRSAAAIGLLHTDCPIERDRLEQTAGIRPALVNPSDARFPALLRGAIAPVAVAVGSGLGNLLHAGPLIRAMATRFGHPIDVIVGGDHDDTLFLLHDPDHVAMVWSLRRPVLERRHRLVFATNSFGRTKLPFAAEKTAWSRDWRPFLPCADIHETVHNLEAGKKLIGLDYKLADAHRSLVNAPPPSGRQPTLVGLHAGSKDGVWATKRWPHFAALARRLRSLGWEVASFGLPSEYVPGTRNCTGGSIAQMADAMADCAWFIANDSGVMNLANAMCIPVLALFGPTNWRTRGPLGRFSRSLVLEKACSPCECFNSNWFKSASCGCLAELRVDEVLWGFDDMRQEMLKGAPARVDGIPVRLDPPRHQE